MKNELHMSTDGRAALEAREGKRNEAYPDPGTGGAPWTIGFGHTGGDVHPGQLWSDEQCDAALSGDLANVYEPPINDAVTIELEQHEFDALVSFAYNIGTGAFERSTLLAKLNAGDKAGAAAEFMRWVIPDMLVGRRRGELAQFLGSDVSADPAPASVTQDAVWAALKSALDITDVAYFQRQHCLMVDAIVGPRTFAAAVRAFQSQNNLVVDGVVGPRTLAALNL